MTGAPEASLENFVPLRDIVLDGRSLEGEESKPAVAPPAGVGVGILLSWFGPSQAAELCRDSIKLVEAIEGDIALRGEARRLGQGLSPVRTKVALDLAPIGCERGGEGAESTGEGEECGRADAAKAEEGQGSEALVGIGAEGDGMGHRLS